MDFIELDKKYIDVKIALQDINNSFQKNLDDKSIEKEIIQKTAIYAKKYNAFNTEIERLLNK